MLLSSVCVGLVLTTLVEGQCSGTTTISSSAEATSLASCKTFDGDVIINSKAAGSLSLGGISEITGRLSTGYSGDLVSLSAGDLVTIGEDLTIRSNDLLTSLHFPALANLDELYLSSLPNLTDFGSTSGLTNVTTITIRETKFENLDWLKPKYIGSLTIEDNPTLNDISLPIVNTSSWIQIEQNGPKVKVSFPDLQGAYNISVINCETIDLPSLVYVNNSIGFIANTFQNLDIPKLLTVDGYVMFWNNTALSRLNLLVLTNVSDDITFHGNTALQKLSIPELYVVGGDITINGSITSIALPALNSVVGDVYVQSSYAIDCSTLAPYDSSNVFKGQYHCNGTSTTAPKSSNNNSTETGTPASSGSSSSSGLSGGAKGGIAAGVITGVLILALAVFFPRKRKRSAHVKPDDDFKESQATGLAELAPKERDGHEKSDLLGQQRDTSGQPMSELPLSQQSHHQPAPNHSEAGNDIHNKSELDALVSGNIANFAELSSDPYHDAAELEETKPRSELPSSGASSTRRFDGLG